MECTRPATEADLERLVELCRLARGEAEAQRGGWVAVRREARPEPVERSLTTALTDPEQLVVVGELEGYVVGYGVVRVERLQDGALLGVVDELFTESPFRELGVGEAIMDELVAFSVERRCIGVDSFALPGDRETKNFFEGFGLKARAILVHRSLVEAELRDAQTAGAGLLDGRSADGPSADGRPADGRPVDGRLADA